MQIFRLLVKKARAFENSNQTMWNAFAKRGGTFQNQSTDEGIDRFSLWKKDVEFMKNIGLKHYRTSISMSRTLNKDNTVNLKAIKWYRTYFKELKKHNIKIYATLYHWELPQYLYEKGGWTNTQTIDTYLQHVRTTIQELGDLIDVYFLMNELWCISMNSYYHGIHAPGEKSLHHALQIAHNLLLAQGLGFEIIKKINQNAQIGTVSNARPVYPFTQSDTDKKAAIKADGVFNRWFLDPLFKGSYPQDIIELYGKQLPDFPKSDFKTIKVGHKLDMFGVNFYRGKFVQKAKTPLGYEDIIKPHTLTNDLGWPITIRPNYPDCLYDMLTIFYKRYKTHGLKNIYITENGMAQSTPWNGKDSMIKDHRRIYYYQEHLIQVHKAIKSGIPVKGYFAWTLMDNYEWEHGYKPESAFGLIHVDRKTLKRIPKLSYFWYKEVIKTRQLSE